MKVDHDHRNSELTSRAIVTDRKEEQLRVAIINSSNVQPATVCDRSNEMRSKGVVLRANSAPAQEMYSLEALETPRAAA